MKAEITFEKGLATTNQAVSKSSVEIILGDVYKGKDGDSAYKIAVENGFMGSEQEWLDSLKVTTDAELNGESNNAIANSAVTGAITELEDEVKDVKFNADVVGLPEVILPDNFNYLSNNILFVDTGLITAGGIGHVDDGDSIYCCRIDESSEYKLTQFDGFNMSNVNAIRVAFSSSISFDIVGDVQYNVGGTDDTFITSVEGAKYMFFQIRNTIDCENLVLQKREE